MFEADRPILKSDQDRLGRTTFAKYLARCMLEHKSQESLVIGLNGAWGTGKTSLINLTLEELKYASNNMFDYEKPIILNFSAWSYSGQKQLIYSFFRRLSSEMNQADYFENSANIIYLLELYISFFTHKPVPRSLRLKLALRKRFFKKKAEEDAYGWESGRDLTQVKAELNELLRKQRHKLIIIIDNIARVDDREVKEVFQIVKSIGDFSNTVYLLSMDKPLAISAIDRVYGSGGKELLDKVIQLPFDVPPISKQDLEVILLDKLNKVILEAPLDSWNGKYWADIYYSTLKYFFQSCRDITRYVNTLSFEFNHIKEVTNPVDLFSITALEVFEPLVYEGVRDNKDLFTDLVYQIVTDPKQIAKDKVRVEEIINRGKNIPHALIKKLLIHLFPRLHSIYQSNMHFYHSETLARKYKRICSWDLFDVYFRLSLSSGTIHETEFDAILALENNSESFDLMLTRLNQDDRILKFLDLLDGIDPERIHTKNIPNIILALLDNADLFPEGKISRLSFNTPQRIHRILHQLLRRFDTAEKRFEIFSEAINKTLKSLFILTHELNEQSHEHEENTDTFIPLEHRDFTPSQLNKLKELTVGRIHEWIKTQRLGEHPKLIAILFAWKKWGYTEECVRYVKELCSTDKGLVLFLTAALKEPITQAMHKQHTNTEWKNFLVNIDSFIPHESIATHAVAIFEDDYFEKLRENEQLALLIFLDLINAKTRKVIPKTTV